MSARMLPAPHPCNPTPSPRSLDAARQTKYCQYNDRALPRGRCRTNALDAGPTRWAARSAKTA
eukprot:10533763-Lingulodinium_polyedra.AAC.1